MKSISKRVMLNLIASITKIEDSAKEKVATDILDQKEKEFTKATKESFWKISKSALTGMSHKMILLMNIHISWELVTNQNLSHLIN